MGGLVGGGLVKYFSIVGISPPSSISALTSLPIGTTFYADFSWRWILIFFALAQVVAILAALYPASIASRQEPVEALRHI
jgi:ABC-type lipoprotein release transport system permease subunit